MLTLLTAVSQDAATDALSEIGVDVPHIVACLLSAQQHPDPSTITVEPRLLAAAAVAARNQGVLPIRWRKDETTERWHATAPFPVQSWPRTLGGQDLRAAWVPTRPHRKMLITDWISSHWQILAVEAEDAAMLHDVEQDIYAVVNDEFLQSRSTRDGVKVAMAAWLNGAGDERIAEVSGLPLALAHTLSRILRAEVRQGRRWPRLPRAVQRAAHEAGTNESLGVVLMRWEARALTRAIRAAAPAAIDGHAELALWLHDGAAWVIPDGSDVADRITRAMADVLPLVRKDVRPSWNPGGAWRSPQEIEQFVWTLAEQHDGEIPAVMVAALDSGRAAAAQRTATNARERNRWKAAQATVALALRDAAIAANAGIVNVEPAPTENFVVKVLLEDPCMTRVGVDVRTGQVVRMDMPPDTPVTQQAVVNPDLVVNELCARLENVYGVTVGTRVVDPAMRRALAARMFDPLLSYFTWLEAQNLPEPLERDEDIADVLIPERQKNAWDATLLWSLLIATVARTFQPGADVQFVLTLVGARNLGKTTFFRDLAPLGSYTEEVLDPSAKDTRMAMGSAFVCWDELRSLHTKDADALKTFITQQTDDFRPPYGKARLVHPRRSVLVATSNEVQALPDDPAIARRFWMIRMTGRWNRAWLAEHKSSLWAAAVRRFRAGATWNMDDATFAAVCEHNEMQHTVIDPWREHLEDLVLRLGDSPQKITSLLTLLGVHPKDQTSGMMRRLARLLREAGWSPSLHREDGKPPARWWRPPSPVS